MTKIIGHRGSKGEWPENTLLGFRKAIENDADGIELDVHMTKDEELVVIHDETIDRTTNGKGEISKIMIKKLKKLDAGLGEKIPTLQEAIDIIKQKNKIIFIELKCDNIEKKIVDIVKKNDIMHLAIIKSFNHRQVKKIKEINKNIKTACLIVGLPIKSYKLLDDANAEILSINLNYVDAELIEECHKKNKKVFIWNIDEIKDLKKYVDMGADYIGTNLPSIIRLDKID